MPCLPRVHQPSSICTSLHPMLWDLLTLGGPNRSPNKVLRSTTPVHFDHAEAGPPQAFPCGGASWHSRFAVMCSSYTRAASFILPTSRLSVPSVVPEILNKLFSNSPSPRPCQSGRAGTQGFPSKRLEELCLRSSPFVLTSLYSSYVFAARHVPAPK